MEGSGAHRERLGSKFWLLLAHGPFGRCEKEWWHTCLFWQSIQEANRSGRLWGIFHGFADALEALKAIYDLLESEPEFDMPGLLLIFLRRTATRLLHWDISCGNLLYMEEVRPTELTKYFTWTQILFYLAFIESEVSPLVSTVKARAQCLSQCGVRCYSQLAGWLWSSWDS